MLCQRASKERKGQVIRGFVAALVPAPTFQSVYTLDHETGGLSLRTAFDVSGVVSVTSLMDIYYSREERSTSVLLLFDIKQKLGDDRQRKKQRANLH